ncbi:MAG: sulfotransferase [Planctomycetota bacterium]
MTAHDADAHFAQHPPIILIGTQRSGTTYLGDALGRQPDAAYWIEPRHVWVRGNAYTPDDRLTADHATPRVRSQIRKTFYDYTRKQSRPRLTEKTPSNCLRLPFIDAVFPEAKLLLIVRDGRSVLRSTGEIINKGMPTSRIVRRALETHPADWPAEFGRLASAVTRKVTKKPLRYWGPRPPGWRDWIGLPADAMLANQWVGGLSTALDDAETLNRQHDGDRVLVFKYEQLMREPRETASRIAAFCELADQDAFVDYITSTADATRMDKWRAQFDDATLEQIEPIMRDKLESLGYTW